MQKKNVVFFTWSNEVTALEQLRVMSPYKSAGFRLIQGVENNQLRLERVQADSFVVIQRDFPVHFSAYQRLIEFTKRNSIPVVLDLDDYLINMPEDHPNRLANDYTAALLPLLLAIQEVDFVTVSTEPLKQLVQPYNSNVKVLPNYLDEELWSFKDPAAAISLENKPIVLLFMGTPSHTPDLELISPVLVKLLSKYEGRLRFLCYGPLPPKSLQAHPFVEYHEGETYNYSAFIRNFLEIRADIAIAPLRDNPFNQCKSNLKFFEYSALGVPGVFSDLSPYIGTVANNVNGFVADTLTDWETKLEGLIVDQTRRHNLAMAAQADVKNNWILSNHAAKWQEFGQVLSELPIQNFKDDRQHNDLVEIARQLESLQQQQSSSRLEMLNAYANLQSIEQSLRQELGEYLSSLSWKITRPLRLFKKLIRRNK